jgi:hypothetical protein
MCAFGDQPDHGPNPGVVSFGHDSDVRPSPDWCLQYRSSKREPTTIARRFSEDASDLLSNHTAQEVISTLNPLLFVHVLQSTYVSVVFPTVLKHN